MKTKPKPNDIWKTKAGRYVFIVSGAGGSVCMLWYDSIDENWCVSVIKEQLDSLVSYGASMSEFVKLVERQFAEIDALIKHCRLESPDVES